MKLFKHKQKLEVGKTYKIIKRDSRGRFTSLKRSFFRLVRGTFTVMFLGGVVYIAFLAGRYVEPDIPVIQVVEAEKPDTLYNKIEQLKANLLDDLMACESRGYDNEDGIIIFDSNNEASIGQFQYQRDTVVYYWKKFYNEDISRKDAILIALDEEKSRELTEKIIFEDEGKAYNNWYNCAKKHDFKTRVAVIKELMQ